MISTLPGRRMALPSSCMRAACRRMLRSVRLVSGQFAWPGTDQVSHSCYMTAMPRYDRWMMRVIERQLGVWGEYWTDLSVTKQFADWRPLVEGRLGVGNVWYFMTRELLPEVMYAAGGVEREFGLFQAAMANVTLSTQESATRPPYSSPDVKWPLGKNVSPKSMRDVSYGFTNMLTWVRSVEERTDRPYKAGERAGLLPALARGPLYDAVNTALEDLRTVLRDSRFFANHALHSGAVPGGGTPRAEILPDGQIIARLPDPLPGPVLTWEEFKFTGNRDMLTYTTEVMSSVETFVEEVLEAFEVNRPARVGPLPPLTIDALLAEMHSGRTA